MVRRYMAECKCQECGYVFGSVIEKEYGYVIETDESITECPDCHSEEIKFVHLTWERD